MSGNRIILAYAALTSSDAATARGRALLFEVLHAVSGRRFDASDLRFGSHGRPYLDAGPSFSISHCQGLLAIAVCASGPIGIDVEPATRTLGRAIRKVCDAEERLRAEAVGAARVWVAKEAAIKCLGLSALMAGQVRLCAGPAAAPARDGVADSSSEYALMRGQALYVARPLLAPGFEVAIARPTRIADNDITMYGGARA